MGALTDRWTNTGGSSWQVQFLFIDFSILIFNNFQTTYMDF